MNKLPEGLDVETVRFHSSALIPGIGQTKMMTKNEMPKSAKMVFVRNEGLFIDAGEKITHIPATAVESVVLGSAAKPAKK